MFYYHHPPMPEEFIFFIKPSQANTRLDLFLAKMLPQWSRAAWQMQIKNGDVRVNNQIVKPSHILIPHETILAIPPVPVTTELIPNPDLDLQIIYADDSIAIINKPAGLVVHPGVSTAGVTLVHGLLARFPQLAAVKGTNRPGIVHRLDKNTSGLMVVALDDIACQSLTSQFASHSVLRGYLFLCWGELNDYGMIEKPIGRHPTHRQQMAVVPWGRPASTRYMALATYRDVTLGAARLGSGRTHQVRVHLSSIGHPLVGDATYGGKALGNLRRQALHSALLGFVHPISGNPMRWELPLPDDIAATWRGTSGGLPPPPVDWEVLTEHDQR
jgi:23S rRNA pseudouridine1911/1915/1917 synthase